ncbi:hypothetical protein TCAL_04112 [Tigriopus californicus]|uniref:Thioredoxin domain-containing protein n=1 Tax=Tigriopus californicus TaxID=6832 RepID=A0A553NUM4_TIGCA|nr:hypothetical protein TCAL_04112 [Tigriopus californicus]|eukprot:TCALIF_04112-PA protein Name:"Similar to TP02_0602 Thioredoxin domain-containing protein (Theileria parva)" AED:0.07 eAED:0.07 QI:177/0.75/1/1/1/1/5/278/274
MMRWGSMWGVLVVLASLECLLVRRVQANNLETLEDGELLKLIRQEQYVIVLFCENDVSGRCVDYETELSAVREDLVDSLNAWVIRAQEKSELRKNFATDNDPVVIYFRRGVPALYPGTANEEEMLAVFSTYRESCVQELTDTNFEHLTQASTGATTGDWFVMFIRDDCEECDRMIARWETLACLHKGRLNVARINKSSTGAVTSRRFEVGIPPEYIFDDLIQLCVDYIRDYPLMVAGFVALPIFLALVFYFLLRSEEKPRSKKKKTTSTKKKSN